MIMLEDRIIHRNGVISDCRAFVFTFVVGLWIHRPTDIRILSINLSFDLGHISIPNKSIFGTNSEQKAPMAQW
uniref:Uncharacterized protein n=1 Tax=Romanomermis culicivorax TaxID=13658 RepID=A0A915JB79_ROMCU